MEADEVDSLPEKENDNHVKASKLTSPRTSAERDVIDSCMLLVNLPL